MFSFGEKLIKTRNMGKDFERILYRANTKRADTKMVFGAVFLGLFGEIYCDNKNIYKIF